MRPNRYLDDYLHGLEFLGGVYPDDAGAIAGHGIVADLDDDDAFVSCFAWSVQKPRCTRMNCGS